ncbi:MAG: hypothetical protein ABI461_15950, partial [Polyangiaceae bacterium]
MRRIIASARGDRSLRPWREVVGIVHALAGALAACEQRALFPGPLRWSGVALDPPCIAAEPLVRAMVGAAGSHPQISSDPSLKWTPPEQAAGAPWDGAANRYVLGLFAYRLISGRHPFEGGGLRHAAQEQASSEPPPFEEEIARALRPGVQSFVLRLLASDRTARPANAAAIATQCEQLLADESKKRNAPQVVGERRKEAPLRSVSPLVAQAKAAPAVASWIDRVRIHRASLAPLLVGIAAAFIAFAARSEDAPIAPKISPVTPVVDGRAEKCGSCHAREVAEWSRSAMAYAAKSPLYGGLESLVEEQFGKSETCPNGAGVLRNVGSDACLDPRTRTPITGAGGEDWCVNCHSPTTNLGGINASSSRPKPMASWRAVGNSAERAPAKDLLDELANEGVTCVGCHTSVHGVAPASRGGASRAYEGNAGWTSPFTGAQFLSRPEEALGVFGIANSAYFLDARAFFRDLIPSKALAGDPVVHKTSTQAARDYRASSEFCGACHDVRLFGTDVVGVRAKGEHFKRLRNAYSEWRAWAKTEENQGRKAATCQGCHMSLYPGSCDAGAAKGKDDPRNDECPRGTHFVSHGPGEMPQDAKQAIFSHYFTSVDFPLATEFPQKFIDDQALDAFGVPVGMRPRQRLLLKASFDFSVATPRRAPGGQIEIPIAIENVGAGHRVPAGFSQEREIWVELTVSDARGARVYQVGHVDAR